MSIVHSGSTAADVDQVLSPLRHEVGDAEGEADGEAGDEVDGEANDEADGEADSEADGTD